MAQVSFPMHQPGSKYVVPCTFSVVDGTLYAGSCGLHRGSSHTESVQELKRLLFTAFNTAALNDADAASFVKRNATPLRDSSCSETGQTVLHLAVEKGLPITVAKLIERGDIEPAGTQVLTA